MDLGAFLGVVLALFFGGLGIGYGGYSVQSTFPPLAVFSSTAEHVRKDRKWWKS